MEIVRGDIEVDSLRGQDISVRVVLDNVQSWNVIIGCAYTQQPRIAYLNFDDQLILRDRPSVDLSKIEVDQVEKPSHVTTKYKEVLQPVSINFVQLMIDNEGTNPSFFNPSYEQTKMSQCSKIGESIIRIESAPELATRVESFKSEKVLTEESVTGS